MTSGFRCAATPQEYVTTLLDAAMAHGYMVEGLVFDKDHGEAHQVQMVGVMESGTCNDADSESQPCQLAYANNPSDGTCPTDACTKTWTGLNQYYNT